MDDAVINVPLVCKDDTVEAIIRPIQANDAAGGGLPLSMQSVSFQKMPNSVAAVINPTSVNLNVNCSMQQQQLGQQQQQQQQQLPLLQQTNFVGNNLKNVWHNQEEQNGVKFDSVQLPVGLTFPQLHIGYTIKSESTLKIFRVLKKLNL
uniref:Uncharacterized protein n=1 Tax=Glossina palpalis gambiensis TaxID=67801 RepID=A0A1B0B5U1_9MUSC